ncbi:MAG TPA: hypothetical protein VG267_21390 [Terracidiphilus sp.]|jgi:hypothetical protein|nr:hypothetical protein [Terracidiphilus sp.]
MKRFRWIVLDVLAILALAAGAGAQTALSIAPEQCVFRVGDDVGWAAVNLDESGWQPASQWTTDSTPEAKFLLRCRMDPAQLAAAVKPGAADYRGRFL